MTTIKYVTMPLYHWAWTPNITWEPTFICHDCFKHLGICMLSKTMITIEMPLMPLYHSVWTYILSNLRMPWLCHNCFQHHRCAIYHRSEESDLQMHILIITRVTNLIPAINTVWLIAGCWHLWGHSALYKVPVNQSHQFISSLRVSNESWPFFVLCLTKLIMCPKCQSAQGIIIVSSLFEENVFQNHLRNDKTLLTVD